MKGELSEGGLLKTGVIRSIKRFFSIETIHTEVKKLDEERIPESKKSGEKGDIRPSWQPQFDGVVNKRKDVIIKRRHDGNHAKFKKVL